MENSLSLCVVLLVHLNMLLLPSFSSVFFFLKNGSFNVSGIILYLFSNMHFWLVRMESFISYLFPMFWGGMDRAGFYFLRLDMYSLNCRLPRRSLISLQKISSQFLKNFTRLKGLQMRGKQHVLLLFPKKFFHPGSCLLTT